MIPSIKKQPFGTIEEQPIWLFMLSNSNGMNVSITNYGGIITSIQVPKNDELIETTLGFNTLEEYLSEDYRKNYPYLGALIGRNAGRIQNGNCPLEGHMWQLTVNHGKHQLHGGFKGFDSMVWKVVDYGAQPNPFVKLEHFSPDGHEGYPGNITVEVTYSLSNTNELKVTYEAQTDATTLLNLTQHAYFNFNNAKGPVTSHVLQLEADHYIPVDDELIPFGTTKNVEGSPLDFREAKQVIPSIDHSFIPSTPGKVGSLFHEGYDILMNVYTDNPIIHIYTGDYIPVLHPKNRNAMGPLSGICFEAQGYSDAPNQPNFPNNYLTPQEKYSRYTIFEFIF
ncbi:aldose epimerase family protein [Imtechella halotolerans]|uniref:Aldose 1-epimerase n=1 Tax=Imtechella halotolerans K1 TaxID=946077 RepID=I0W8K1_9FLAO|nr:aldose epimerase family protein [Imtechella halotolerans]EID72717.1 galactose mutarotase [Imtechella halotolerans K1]WMQ64639.1 aldose epimerase family protein [Imtechella halotolerans]